MHKEILDKIEVRQGDITKLDVDAIVNASKSAVGSAAAPPERPGSPEATT
jgi:hypothetical protein